MEEEGLSHRSKGVSELHLTEESIHIKNSAFSINDWKENTTAS